MGIVTDGDADGLPDDWELFHFGNRGQSGSQDSDGDGITNLNEYNDDTDPSQLTPLTWVAGSATWNASSTTWTGASTIWRNANFDQAVFSTPSGNVTLASGITAGEIVFNTSGYTIDGEPLALAGSSASLTAATNVSASISTALTGASGLVKNGQGTITLSGADANSFTGTTTIKSGTLVLAKANNTNALAGPITIGDRFGSDILRVAANEQIADSSIISFYSGRVNNSAILRIDGNTTETVGGIVTTITEQVPVIESGSAGVATLIVNNSNDCTYNGVLRNANSGTLALVKSGSGDLVLQNSSGLAPISYTGTTTVSSGNLILNSLQRATLSKLVINTFASPITNNGRLTFNQAAGLVETFSPSISGSGILLKRGGAPS